MFCILLIFHHIAHFDADQFPAEKQCVHSTILQHCSANNTTLGAIDRDWPILFPLHVKIIIMYIFRDQIPNEDHTSTEIVWLKNYPQQAPVTKVWISSVLLFFRGGKETLRKSLNSLEQNINLVCKVFLFVFQKTNKTTLNLNFPQWCSHTSMENILTPVIVTGCLWGISAWYLYLRKYCTSIIEIYRSFILESPTRFKSAKLNASICQYCAVYCSILSDPHLTLASMMFLTRPRLVS